jgi:hypothetical protein
MDHLRSGVVALAIFVCVNALASGDETDDAPGWSQPVDGLQARLVPARQRAVNETPIIVTYLELRNVSDRATAIALPIDGEDVVMEFSVVDAAGKSVPPDSGPFDELRADVGMVRIPYDSTLRLNVAHRGAGIPKGYAAHLDLGALANWEFKPGDKGTYFLKGKVTVKQSDAERWSGTLLLPAVKLPIGE